MVGQKVRARVRDQRTQSGQEIVRGEDHMGATVGVGVAQLVQDPPLGVEREASRGDRRARDVTTELFELAASIRRYADARVQREAFSTGDEEGAIVVLTECFGRDRGEEPFEFLAVAIQGLATAYRRIRQMKQKVAHFERLFVTAVFCSTLEELLQSRVNTREDSFDFFGRGSREFVEARRRERSGACVDPLDEERVEVDVQVEGAAETLDDVDGS